MDNNESNKKDPILHTEIRHITVNGKSAWICPACSIDYGQIVAVLDDSDSSTEEISDNDDSSENNNN
jgi:hypothetical protein